MNEQQAARILRNRKVIEGVGPQSLQAHRSLPPNPNQTRFPIGPTDTWKAWLDDQDALVAFGAEISGHRRLTILRPQRADFDGVDVTNALWNAGRP